MKKFRFIDLFCGIGGFHQAMSDLGGECVYACDIDQSCRITYENNYGIVPDGDITELDERTLPEFEVLCAGFPCQSFSKAGKRLGFADETKGTLFFDVERIMRYCQPKYALLENVRNLASHDGGNTWKTIHEHLINIGYNVLNDPVIFSPHYLGIPQHRERVFIMCVRKDMGELPMFNFDSTKIPDCSVESIMLDDNEIPNIEHFSLSKEKVGLLNLWDEFIRNIYQHDKKLPSFPIWTEYFKEIEKLEDVSVYPQWKQKFIQKNQELYQNNRLFLKEWLPRARKHPMFFGAKAKLEWQAGLYHNPTLWNHIMQFRPSGIRIKHGTYFPALVAITQTSIVGPRKRELTLRECARLQSFPDTFKPDKIEAQAYKQFGNAVNVECVKLFAKYMFGDAQTLRKYSAEKPIKMVNFLELQRAYPKIVFENPQEKQSSLDPSRNLLVSYVKSENADFFLTGKASVYYTGKKFPSTVELNHLFYFMPYIKGRGIRDLYYIRVARVGTKSELTQRPVDKNDFRLVFEIEFIEHLLDDYMPIRLDIWDTFKNTTLGNILDIFDYRKQSKVFVASLQSQRVAAVHKECCSSAL